MTRRMLGLVPWWAWVVIGWIAGAVVAAVVWARVMRRPAAPTPQLDDPLYRGTDLERLGAAIDADDALLPTAEEVQREAAQAQVLADAQRDLPGILPIGLPGAIHGLGMSTDESTARYWLAMCARRGADQPMLDRLWAAWQRRQADGVRYLFTGNDTTREDGER